MRGHLHKDVVHLDVIADGQQAMLGGVAVLLLAVVLVRVGS